MKPSRRRRASYVGIPCNKEHTVVFKRGTEVIGANEVAVNLRRGRAAVGACCITADANACLIESGNHQAADNHIARANGQTRAGRSGIRPINPNPQLCVGQYWIVIDPCAALRVTVDRQRLGNGWQRTGRLNEQLAAHRQGDSEIDGIGSRRGIGSGDRLAQSATACASAAGGVGGAGDDKSSGLDSCMDQQSKREDPKAQLGWGAMGSA